MYRKICRFGIRGEFRGNFTRDTFKPDHHFSRVLMQQGRVQLDADWNEHVSIMVHYLRNLASDLIGPHGAPRDTEGNPGKGFGVIKANKSGFEINPGHYYVNGILCEGTEAKRIIIDKSVTAKYLLVYLDVWERHLSHVEFDSIREVALGGPDTATRAKIEWQVQYQPTNKKIPDDILKNKNYHGFMELLKEKKPGSARMRSRARRKEKENKEPCLIAPKSHYRGPENQLYRVEIHKGSGDNDVTFKWSRENGSVIFPIIKWVSDNVVSLEHLGRDGRCDLQPNDWVELYDDAYALQGSTDPLIQVDFVDHDNRRITLKQVPETNVGKDPDKHPYLRRWDQKNGNKDGVPLVEGFGERNWINLEDGIQIQFYNIVLEKKENAPKSAPQYYAGDYWLIPARTITGDVEWPGPAENPEDLPPHGVVHHYAPLAFLSRKSKNDDFEEQDLRRHIIKLWE